MEQEIYFSHLRTKFFYLLVKWEEKITFVTILCALFAIGLGMIWIVLKEMVLLYCAWDSVHAIDREKILEVP
jgi:hypothetical protein